MLTYLSSIDQSLFLALNSAHSPFFDHFFYYATRPIVWLPLYLALLVLVIREFRWKTLIVVLTAAILITASDQLANLVKAGSGRLRPSHEPRLEQQVHTVNGYTGGKLGFYSNHASNNFAFALFLILLLRRRYRWLTAVLLLYALIMSYSRIYLGVHYPGDILAGAAIGCLLGCLFAWATSRAMHLRRGEAGSEKTIR